MTIQELLLIRHGESTWNAERRIQGQADPPLSEAGELQAEALSRRLGSAKIAAVYCSPAERAYRTACAIAVPHGLDPLVDARLLEINLGRWQGRRLAELSGGDAALYRAWEIDPIAAPLAGTESLSSALERVVSALECMLQEHAGATIAVVTHSIIGRVALSHLLGSGVTLVSRLHMKKASVSTLRAEHGRMVLERLSDTTHLRSRWYRSHTGRLSSCR